MALSATTQILIAFCKQELFSEVTELIQYVVDLEDDDCPVKFVDKTMIEQLELEAEMLELQEPDSLTNYDAWVEWDEQVSELASKIDTISKKASLTLVGVNEWWMCTKRLGEKLKEHGEVVIFYNSLAIWGRTHFGYDPAYDDIIKKVATDLEILPGMSHDWSKHIQIEK